MSYRAELRVVAPDGTLGVALPDFANLAYLDDDTDVGTVQFDYPLTGRHIDELVEQTELALLIDGVEIPNNRFVIDEADENLVTDDLRVVSWAGQTLLGRLDEALVLPETDEHLREDQVTKQERDARKKQRTEWMQQARKDAVAAAKQKVADTSTGSSTTGDVSGAGANSRGRKAIAWANAQITNPSQNWYNACQSFVRQSFSLPGVYGTAIEAWNSGQKHRQTDPSRIPAGVPVYWTPNHVALSIGNSKCISTDIFRQGQADVCLIAHIAAAWGGHTLLGWTSDVSRVTIWP